MRNLYYLLPTFFAIVALICVLHSGVVFARLNLNGTVAIVIVIATVVIVIVVIVIAMINWFDCDCDPLSANPFGLDFSLVWLI